MQEGQRPISGMTVREQRIGLPLPERGVLTSERRAVALHTLER